MKQGYGGLETIGIPELTLDQLEALCDVAERAARKHILSRVPSHRISDINISVDVEGLRPVTVNIDIEVTLSPLMRGFDVDRLISEAAEKAFQSIEQYLRRISCSSKG